MKFNMHYRANIDRLRGIGWDWRWLLFAVGLFKLWVVAGGEVVTQYYDSESYALSTNGMVWWVSDLPSHTAGFPAIAGIVSQFGIPWRLALEMFYLLACGMLASVIAGLLSSRVIACLFFAAIAWHPWTFSGFSSFMPVPFVLVLLIALLTMMFRVLSQPATQWQFRIFVGLGITAFFWNWSRLEDPLVYASYGLFAVLAWWLTRNPPDSISLIRRLSFLLLPLLLVATLTAGVKAVNYVEFGVYAKSWCDMPGLLALMKVLYKIKPEQQIRYAAVTRQSLQAACEASPCLRQYKGELLNLHHPETLGGERVTKIPGEFGSWLNWLLPNSMPGNFQEKNVLMTRAAAEINEALRSGQLPKRSAHFPLDPNWRLWMPDLLPCTVNALRQGISMNNFGTDRSFKPDLERVFDDAANRRSFAANPYEVHVEGRIHGSSNAIQGVMVVDQWGRIVAATQIQSNKIVSDEQVFWLRIPIGGDNEEYRLAVLQGGRLTISGGEAIHVGTAGNKEWHTELSHHSHPIMLPDTNQAMEYSARVEAHISRKAKRFLIWEQRSEWICKSLTGLLLAVTFVVVILKPAWDMKKLRLIFACWVLALGWLLGRALLYGLMDANVGWGVYFYMPPIAPLFILILGLGTALASAVLKITFMKSRQ